MDIIIDDDTEGFTQPYEEIIIPKRRSSIRRYSSMLGKRKSFTTTKKSAPRKKSKYGSSFNAKRTQGPNSNGAPTIKVIEYVNAQISCVAATTTHSTIGFTLGNLSQVASYQALFDEYRIVKAILKIRPAQNSCAPGAPCHSIWTVKDFDDATAFTTDAEYLANDTLKVTMGWEDHIRSLAPQVQVVDSAGNKVYAPSAGWLPTANKDAVHYGIKYQTRSWSAATPITNFFIMQEIHFEFRGTK